MNKPTIVIEVSESKVVKIISDREVDIIFKDEGTETYPPFIEFFPAIVDAAIVSNILNIKEKES